MQKLVKVFTISCFIIFFLTLAAIYVQNSQKELDEKIKAFELELPETVRVMVGNVGGWSDHIRITDVQTFFSTLKLYEIREIWRTRYGTYAKYSFVHGGIVYYYLLE